MNEKKTLALRFMCPEKTVEKMYGSKKQHKAGKEKMMFDWRADGPDNGLTAR